MLGSGCFDRFFVELGYMKRKNRTKAQRNQFRLGFVYGFAVGSAIGIAFGYVAIGSVLGVAIGILSGAARARRAAAKDDGIR